MGIKSEPRVGATETPPTRVRAGDRRPARSKQARRSFRGSTTWYLLACGAVGPPLFVLVVLIEGATRPGYSPWRHAISQLSLGAQGWVNITALLAFGLLALGFARGLRQVWRPGTGSRWLPRLIAVFGLSLILAGIAVTDPGLGYPPGSEPSYSLHGLVHSVAGLVLFGSLSAACLVLGRSVAGDPRWAGWARYSVVTGIVVAVFFIATGVTTALDQNGILSPAPSGLLQRVSLFSGLAWMMLLAVRLMRGKGLAQ